MNVENSIKTRYSRLFFVSGLICLISLFTVNSATAADFAIMIKSGAVRLWDDKQRLDGVERDFDDSGNKIYSVAWEVRNEKNVGMGMEYTNYRHEFTSPGVKGLTRTQVYLFTAKKYFEPAEMFRPFVGIGIGGGHAKYDDGIGNVDRDFNTALQASVGIEFLFAENFGLYTELKGLASNTDGEIENEFDFSSTSFMVGVSFVF